MRGAERIIFAFRPLGETGQPAAGPQCANPVAAAGQDFVRISLVSNVPDQLVRRRVEHVMQRDGKLDNAQARAEMAAGHGDGGDRFSTQLVRDLFKVRSA